MSIIYTGTSAIWSYWTTSTTSTSTDIYSAWISNSTGTTTATSDLIFPAWITEYASVQQLRAMEIERDLERQQQIEQQRQQYHQRYLEEQKKKQGARRKAKILLLENLNEQQHKEYTKEGFFFVVSPSGRLYRIREGRSINIDLMKGNSRIEVERRLCAHPEVMCPNEDTMLTQKIYLEQLEQEFLRIAKPYSAVRH